MAHALSSALEDDPRKSEIRMKEAVEVQSPRENDKDKSKTIRAYREYLHDPQLKKDAIEGYLKAYNVGLESIRIP